MKDQEAQRQWSVVRNAYREASPPNIRPEHWSQLGVFASEWLKTKDPSIMDCAISYCHQHSLPILPELMEHVHAAMQKRIADGTSGRKAFKQSAKQRVLEKMAKLVYHGASIRRAAEIGAYVAHFEIDYPMKASSLEKDYSKQRDSLEKFAKVVFEQDWYTEAEVEQMAAKWRAYINADLEIPEEIIGERR